MGQKHLIKTITHSWRVGVKIMRQFKKVTQQTQYQEGRKSETVFGYNTQN